MGSMEDWEKRVAESDRIFKEAMDKSNSLPDGLHVGKIIRMSVADGYAFYEITKVNKTTVRLKWRPDMHLDRWQDRMLGEGGSFRRKDIEPIVAQQDGFRKIFGSKRRKSAI